MKYNIRFPFGALYITAIINRYVDYLFPKEMKYIFPAISYVTSVRS